MKVKFIVEDILLVDSVIEGGKPREIKSRFWDEAEVFSLETVEKEVRELVEQYNKEEKKRYKKYRIFPRKLIRMIDEEKAEQCPQALIWDSYFRQEYQGHCPNCGYEFCYLIRGREKNTKEMFKYCLGFGESRIKKDLVICFECPDCFVKSHFHCSPDWLYLFADWIVEISKVLDK